MDLNIKEEGEFKYLETNPGKPVLMLLHGLMGALSNFDGIIKGFGNNYNVIVPLLPIFELHDTQIGCKFSISNDPLFFSEIMCPVLNFVEVIIFLQFVIGHCFFILLL